MQKKLKKIAVDTDIFLKSFIKQQKKNRSNFSNAVWIISWREKN